MTKAIAKKLFSFIFLFIFFSKMVISIAPLVFTNIDKDAVNAVIMQLELEHNSKETELEKKLSGKQLNSELLAFNFEQPIVHLEKENYFLEAFQHIQPFFPAVPTPPPNLA